MGDNSFKTNSHSRYLLQYHVILVCKYRKRLLSSNNISTDVKRLSKAICTRHNIVIRYMETDKDHIHFMIETAPNTNLPAFVRTLKSYTTYHLWNKYQPYLSKCFWKEHTFWNDGYFIATIGNVSGKVIKEYIENQGKE